MEYVTYVADPKDLQDGRENKLVIKNLEPGPRKYEARYVKAMVSSTPDTIPGADTLWLRTRIGHLKPKPWAIKIIEELDIYAP